MEIEGIGIKDSFEEGIRMIKRIKELESGNSSNRIEKRKPIEIIE